MMMMLLLATDVENLLNVVDTRRHGDSQTIDTSPISSVYDSASDTNHSPMSADQSGE